jgi:NADH:ubiquinone oxidoreductase subunit 2 (subunit N)
MAEYIDKRYFYYRQSSSVVSKFDMSNACLRAPLLALVMLVLMIQTAGVPPFVGFWAKLRIIQELWATDHPWLLSASHASQA